MSKDKKIQEKCLQAWAPQWEFIRKSYSTQMQEQLFRGVVCRDKGMRRSLPQTYTSNGVEPTAWAKKISEILEKHPNSPQVMLRGESGEKSPLGNGQYSWELSEAMRADVSLAVTTFLAKNEFNEDKLTEKLTAVSEKLLEYIKKMDVVKLPPIAEKNIGLISKLKNKLTKSHAESPKEAPKERYAPDYAGNKQALAEFLGGALKAEFSAVTLEALLNEGFLVAGTTDVSDKTKHRFSVDGPSNVFLDMIKEMNLTELGQQTLAKKTLAERVKNQQVQYKTHNL